MPQSAEKPYTADEFYKLNITDPCELINGYIRNMSPSPNIEHQNITGGVYSEIRYYIRRNSGKTRAFISPTSVNLSENTVVLPDIFVAGNPDNFDERKFNGAPDWIIEVTSPANSVRDFRDKLYLYEKTGVKEYWIIDPPAERVLLYLFGKPCTAEFYSFSDSISAGIYRESSEPLIIKVDDIL